MIIAGEVDLPVGSRVSIPVTDHHRNWHDMIVLVLREATYEEWLAFIATYGAEQTSPIDHLLTKFYEVATD